MAPAPVLSLLPCNYTAGTRHASVQHLSPPSAPSLFTTTNDFLSLPLSALSYRWYLCWWRKIRHSVSLMCYISVFLKHNMACENQKIKLWWPASLKFTAAASCCWENYHYYKWCDCYSGLYCLTVFSHACTSLALLHMHHILRQGDYKIGQSWSSELPLPSVKNNGI